MESDESRTNVLSKTAGVREARKFFSIVHRDDDNGDEEQDDEDDSPLLDLDILLKKTWNIYGVSALFHFDAVNQVILKKYAKKLREEVACMLSQEDVSYEARVAVLDDLRRPKRTDHPVVQISVTAQVASKQKSTEVYLGYLISWRSDASDILEHTSRLPLLLCRGTVNTMRAVHIVLSRMFDAIIMSMPATADDLAWMLPILLSPSGGQDQAKKEELAQLEFTVPGLPSTDKINVKFKVNDLKKLWESFYDLRKEKIEAEDVEMFQKILLRQLFDIGNLQLGLCVLHKISLPSLTISGSKMKITNVEAMNIVLLYLNEKAMDALHMNISQLNISK